MSQNELHLMDGKVCLVTGATHGIGKETALALAQMGATVVIVGRNEAKCAAVVSKIKQASGNEAVEAMIADLSVMTEVRALADQFKATYPKLHVLVNDVGASSEHRQVTPEGFEKTFALNHLSYFLLTDLLLERLKASAPARIGNVSSAAHKGVQMDFDDLQFEKNYTGFIAYKRSKLANVMFTYELARRLAGTGVTANVPHPGLGRPDFERDLGLGFGARTSLGIILPYWGLEADQGAQTSIYLASSPEVEGVTGKYWERKTAVRSGPSAYNESAWTQLWGVSEKLVTSTEAASLVS